MINPVTNLILSTQSSESLTLKFDIHTGDIGGYWLYKSTDGGITYSRDSFKIDSTITTESGGTKTYNDDTYTYFSYGLGTDDYGRQLFFYIVAVSTIWEESVPSNVASVYTTPNSPNNFSVIFDNFDVILSWDAPSTTNGKNTAISKYAIYRGTYYSAGTGIIDNNIITNSLLTLGNKYLIIDKQKKSIWEGIVETNGEVTLSSDNQSVVADTSEDYSTTADSIEIFIYSNDSELIAYTTDTNYTDTTFLKNTIYLYSIAVIGYESNYSDLTYQYLLTPDLKGVTPYLRYIGNSANTFLNNKYWRILRDILIDKNYYNKSQFSIPYLSNETYNFKGYVGVANCKLDVFINGSIYRTSITDDYGNFEFNASLSKGESLIQLQARDRKNISFSNKSNRYKINTVNIYTFFAALGKEYTDIWTEILAQQVDNSFIDGRYLAVESRISPLLGIYKDVSEEDENFRNILIAIYNCYIYVGFKEALNMLFEALKTYSSEIDSYEIFYNNEFYDTFVTNKMPVVRGYQLTSTGLVRAKYWYAVTSYSTDGEESDAIIIPCDSRWWPIYYDAYEEEVFKGYNVLQWDEAPGVEFYKVYRYIGHEYSEITDFDYLTTTFGNFFVDTGNVATSTGDYPPPYNITNLEKPSNLRVLYDVKISNQFMALRKRNWLGIFIYAVENNSIPEFQKERILTVCRDVIPLELGYDIVIANNTSVENITAVLPNTIPIRIFNLSGSPRKGMYLDINGTYNNFDVVAYGLTFHNNITDKDGLTFYDAVYYDSTTYEYVTALYESEVYVNTFIHTKVYTWSTNSVYTTVSYRKFTNYTFSEHRNYTVTGWTQLSMVAGKASLAIAPNEEIQFRIIMNAPTWDSSQYFILESIL
jgi:hypothetical protein